MLRPKSGGQLSVGMVWTIVALLIAIAIGGFIFSEINEVTVNQVSANEYETNGSTFPSLSAWSTDNTDNLKVAHDGANNWANVENIGPNGGTATIYQDISDVDSGASVESATVEAAYQSPSAADNFTENIKIQLKDPSGNVDTLKEKTNATTAFTWVTYSGDVSDYIDEDGAYRLQAYVEADNTNENGVIEVNVDNLKLTIDTESTGEMTQNEAESGASTVFPLLVIIAIVAVIVAIMKLFGGI